MATVRLSRGAETDVAKADGSQLDSIAKGLNKLRTSPHLRGEPLRDQLEGLRKLIVGSRNLRIVYLYVEESDEVLVIAIGHRRDEAVYKLALSRISDDPADSFSDIQSNNG
jgi:mRNA-degrading endonuclease RelE of RelBE toxin-antitoxin system